jgi:hypothetical protein
MQQQAENLKGNLEGKAQFLSKFIRSSELTGKVEETKSTLYQSGNTVVALWEAQSLTHMFCELLSNTSISDEEKLKNFLQFQKAMQGPRSELPWRGWLQPNETSLPDSCDARHPK